MGKKKHKTEFVKLKGSEGDDWMKLALTHLAGANLFDERMKQWKKWSYKHDDKNAPEDWARIISDIAENLTTNTDSKKLTKKYLVQIGAVALAALEADMRRAKR